MWLVQFWVTLLMTLWAGLGLGLGVGFRDASCKLEQNISLYIPTPPWVPPDSNLLLMPFGFWSLSQGSSSSALSVVVYSIIFYENCIYHSAAF